MYILYIVVCPFVLFLLAIVLSVLLRYTDSDYPFSIFKLFVQKRRKTKQKHNTICVEHHYAQANINNVNKTWAFLQRTGDNWNHEWRSQWILLNPRKLESADTFTVYSKCIEEGFFSGFAITLLMYTIHNDVFVFTSLKQNWLTSLELLLSLVYLCDFQ